ncbi:hypothetical protein KDN24_21385 [Bacillus sp. Bva_UNVM-123]|uniref:hypothetical protein n=1 Tax=Bacillus sp. Bva_UNVM-123 TaxID=2829798 RepID=UPI00391FA10B
MKLLSKWILLFGLFGFILSGCGTSNEAGNKANGTDATQNNEQTTQNGNEQTTDDGKVDEQNNEGSQEETVRAEEQTIKYNVNGEAKEETALLQLSDNQHYSMYVLPDFELTAEEPNKDVVMLSKDGHHFMRIELIPKDNDWNSLQENTKAQLEAVNENVQTIETPKDEFFKDAVAMEVQSDNDVVTSYLVKNQEQQLKLTIFSQKDAEYKDAFLQMAKTIVKNEQ